MDGLETRSYLEKLKQKGNFATLQEVSNATGLSQSKIVRFIKAGQLNAVGAEGKYLISIAELEKWLHGEGLSPIKEIKED